MGNLNHVRVLAVSILVAGLLGICSVKPAWAQGGATGALSGTVLDSSGGVIANATIQVIDTGTKQIVRSVATNSTGAFVITLLSPGKYVIVVNASGFGEARVESVEVRVTETTTLHVVLKPGSVTAKVEVSAEIVTVNTENPTTGQTIEHEVISTLPLATQNFQQLLALSSGATSALNNSEQLGRGNVRINVNGQREDNNNYLIEGISATDYNLGELTTTPLPSADVIAEFKVQTSLYDASQGRNGGGNINAVLRTGTNVWHGDAFEYFRNDVLNANDFFLKLNGQPRPETKQNIFGGSVGGPLGKDGLFGFIFGNYQGSRQRSGDDLGTDISTSIPVIPAADRTEGKLITTFFPGGLPPGVKKLDPIAVNLLNSTGNQFCDSATGFLIPTVPGAPGASGPLACSNPGKFSDNQFTTNWDREFREHKEKVAVRFFFSNSDTLKPFGGGGLTTDFGAPPAKSDLNFPLDTPINARFLNATWTHIVSNSKVNEFRFGYVRIVNSFTNVPPPGITATNLGINRPMNPITDSIYKFVFISSGFQLGPSPGDMHAKQNNFVLNDVFSWIHGKHELRFGGEFDRMNLNKTFPQIFNGLIFFSNTPANPVTLQPALSDFQNFLLGSPQFSFGESGVFTHDYHHNNFSVFFQDDWKATPNLTVNAGLRVEVIGAWYDNDCHIGNFDPAPLLTGGSPYIFPKCVNKFNVAGLTGTAGSTTLNNAYSTGWGPRLGLAYDVLGKHTTTVRGGFGIYYVQEDVGNVDQLSFSSPLLDVVFAGGPPGCLANFFEPVTPAGCPNPNPNGLPPVGLISPAFVPVVSQLTGFVLNGTSTPTADTSQTPVYNNTGVNLFGLQVPRHFIVPNVMQWNLTVQRELGSKWVLEVGYVGAHTIHLRETHDALQSILVGPAPNQLVITGAGGQPFTITKNTASNAIARSHFQGVNGYGGFEDFADDAFAHYHSLQTTISRRWASSYFQAAYTFSKSTDTTSSFNTAFNTLFNNQTSLAGSHGLSDFDRTHRLVASYLYNLPFFDKVTGWKAHVLKGWSVTGISVFQSGVPFSIVDSGAGSAFVGLTTVPNTTADLAPGATLASGLTPGGVKSRLAHYVTPLAFTTAPVIGDDGVATGFGTLGRNIFRGPFEQNWDFSIIKYFSITERHKVRFTTDFFNIWNHPAFSNPAFLDVQIFQNLPAGVSPLTTSFGKITTTENNPRIIQFSLKYSF